MGKKMQQVEQKKGFSIFEIIMVVAIISVLLVGSFPDLLTFLGFQDRQTEVGDMEEIRNALQAYARENGDLPTQATWNTDLAQFTNLSANEIATDTWGRPRQYRVTFVNEVFQDAIIQVFYAIVYSYGSDAEIDVNSNLGAFAPPFSDDPLLDFPVDAALAVAAYNAFSIGQTADVAIKFSDGQAKISAYEESRKRMDRIVEALDDYSQRHYYEIIINGGNTARNFFPPATASEGVADIPDGEYAAPAVDTGNFGADSRVSNDPNDDATRRTDMIELMRVLGLPDSFCCNALNGEAFFYFSNPRPKTGASTCGARPTGPPLQPFLPPRLTIDFTAAGTANATCG